MVVSRSVRRLRLLVVPATRYGGCTQPLAGHAPQSPRAPWQLAAISLPRPVTAAQCPSLRQAVAAGGSVRYSRCALSHWRLCALPAALAAYATSGPHDTCAAEGGYAVQQRHPALALAGIAANR